MTTGLVFAGILVTLIIFGIVMSRANSGKSRDVRKATWDD